jgi:hypothetical protein
MPYPDYTECILLGGHTPESSTECYLDIAPVRRTMHSVYYRYRIAISNHFTDASPHVHVSVASEADYCTTGKSNRKRVQHTFAELDSPEIKDVRMEICHLIDFGISPTRKRKLPPRATTYAPSLNPPGTNFWKTLCGSYFLLTFLRNATFSTPYCSITGSVLSA